MSPQMLLRPKLSKGKSNVFSSVIYLILAELNAADGTVTVLGSCLSKM